MCISLQVAFRVLTNATRAPHTVEFANVKQASVHLVSRANLTVCASSSTLDHALRLSGLGHSKYVRVVQLNCLSRKVTEPGRPDVVLASLRGLIAILHLTLQNCQVSFRPAVGAATDAAVTERAPPVSLSSHLHLFFIRTVRVFARPRGTNDPSRSPASQTQATTASVSALAVTVSRVASESTAAASQTVHSNPPLQILIVSIRPCGQVRQVLPRPLRLHTRHSHLLSLA